MARTPPRGPGSSTLAPNYFEKPTAAHPPPAATQLTRPPVTTKPPKGALLRRSAGPLVALLTVVAVGFRQLSSNAAAPAPWSDAETALAVNAYALPRFSELTVSTTLGETVSSWQVAAYSTLTSATDRYELLVGPSREFVVLATVLTAALTIGICRRLRLSWMSSAAAAALAGLPAAAALVRGVFVPATAATFWLALAAFLVLLTADRRPRRQGRQGRLTGLFSRRLGRWPLTLLAAVAISTAVFTAGVTMLVVLGLLFGIAATRRLRGGWTPGRRGVVILGLIAGLVVTLWLTVWDPSAESVEATPTAEVGAVVAIAGLAVAVACWQIAWLRPLTLGAIPILIAAAWPGPAQATASVVSLTVVAVLIASLLDHLVSELRPSGFWLPATAAVLAIAALGTVVLPTPAQASNPTTAANADVVSWIQTQLSPNALIGVEPLNRAQLVSQGLDPDRLIIVGSDSTDFDFLLTPLDRRGDLPLIASFGDGSDALGLCMVVSDPDAFARALAADQIARIRFGNALAENPNMTLGDAARASLEAGLVDARLMVGLAGASSYARFAIEEFATRPGDLAVGTIFREATLTDISSTDMANGNITVRGWLADYFLMQRGVYQALAVIEGGTSLTVRYAAPSPLGLLS